MDKDFYTYINPRMSIGILVNPGIYVFERQSATGKTYLAQLLNKYRSLGEKVIAFNNQDDADGDISQSRLDRIIGNKVEVCLFDRYDLYKHDYHDIMHSIVENGGRVLIDSKILTKVPRDFEFCNIEYERDNITVV